MCVKDLQKRERIYSYMTNNDLKVDCILWGANAWGNFGDELTLAVALHDARSRFGDSVAILSPFPERIEQLFPDAMVIPYLTELLPPRWQRVRRVYLQLRQRGWLPNLRRAAFHFKYGRNIKGRSSLPWIQTLANCKQLYLIGGGYICDLFEADYFLLPLQIAQNHSVSTATAPIGLGPFFSKKTAASVSKRLRNAKVFVRDKASYEFCLKSDIPAILKADDGFRLREIFPELLPENKNLRIQENGVTKIGICIHQQNGNERNSLIEQWWTEFLSRLKRYNGKLHIEGFCFNADPSHEFSTLLRVFEAAGYNKNQVRSPSENFRDAIQTLCNYDLIVSTRFHSIVTASVLGLPYLAFASGEYYINKMSSVREAKNSVGELITPSKTPGAAVEILMSLIKVQ